MNIWGCRLIGISGSLSWSKTLMELIFNPCGEFQWSAEGPVSQIHTHHLHDGAPGIFSDLLRYVQMLKREWVRKTTGSYRTYSSIVKLQPLFLSFRWKTCLCAELQTWFLSFRVKDLHLGRTLWWWYEYIVYGLWTLIYLHRKVAYNLNIYWENVSH